MVNTAVQSRVLQLSGELKSQGVRGVPELFKVAQSIERHHQDSRVKVMVTRPAFANIFLQHMPFLTIEFPASEKLLFIPSFAEAWELRKPTPDYTAFMQKLTRNYSSFVGTESDLEKLLTSLAKHAKFCLEACQLDIPPWRTAECWKRVFVERDPSNITVVTRESYEMLADAASDDDLDSTGGSQKEVPHRIISEGSSIRSDDHNEILSE